MDQIDNIKMHIKGSRFFEFNIKERIRILASSVLITFYFLISFNILQFGTEEAQNVLRIIGAGLLVFILIINLYMFSIDYKVKINMLNNQKRLFLKILIVCLILMIVFYFAGETIGTSSDIKDQFNQAVTGEYNNWHPVAHTFIFYKLPILIFGENLSSTVLFQYLFIALILAYFIWSMLKFNVRISVIIIAITLMLLNNTFRYIIKFPWKDIPFAFSLLFLTINLMWVYHTGGEWLKKRSRVVLFVLSILLVLFLRHNGILAILPMEIVLLIAYKDIRKSTAIIITCVLAGYFAVTLFIYGLLGIEGHPQSFAESMGVPNNQISYIVKKEGTILDEEKEFLSNIMPVGVVWYHYEIGDYNSVKWRKNQAETAYYYNGEFLQENKEKYLKTWFNIIKRNPKLALEGYYYATRELWISRFSINENIDYSVGLTFFLATFFIAAATFRDKRRLVPYIPMLFNMLGIMMLVTGGEIRFVFANLVCGIPLVLFALTLKSEQTPTQT